MSSASGVRSIYLKPVHDRPGLDNLQRINTLNFFVLLNFGLLLANITQFLLLPFNFVPTPWAQDIYQDGIRYTKGALGSLLSQSISSIFHPYLRIDATTSSDHSMVWTQQAGINI
jgi:hypothetical protein